MKPLLTTVPRQLYHIFTFSCAKTNNNNCVYVSESSVSLSVAHAIIVNTCVVAYRKRQKNTHTHNERRKKKLKQISATSLLLFWFLLRSCNFTCMRRRLFAKFFERYANWMQTVRYSVHFLFHFRVGFLSLSLAHSDSYTSFCCKLVFVYFSLCAIICLVRAQLAVLIILRVSFTIYQLLLAMWILCILLFFRWFRPFVSQ